MKSNRSAQMLSKRNKKVIVFCLGLIFFIQIFFVNYTDFKNNNNYTNDSEITNKNTNNDLNILSAAYSNFTDNKKIQINHTKVEGPVANAHLNFPVLISIIDLDLHDHCQSNGNDIAFYNGSIQLDHEIELYDHTYNSTHAHLIAWVRIPWLFTSMYTNITMCYGNSTMGPQENPEGVWDSNYQGVWHLGETLGDANDSTSNGFNGFKQGVTPLGGQIGNAQHFEGDNDWIDTQKNASDFFIGGDNDRTVSAWVYTSTNNISAGAVFSVGKNLAAQQFVLRTITDPNNNYNWRFQSFISSNDKDFYYDTLNKWVFFTVSYDGIRVRIYANGGQEAFLDVSLNTQDQEGNTHTFRMGRYSYVSDYFNGTIDEMRVSNITRSPGWIATEYNNQYDPYSFYLIDLGQYIPSGGEANNIVEEEGDENNANEGGNELFIYFSLLIIGVSIIVTSTTILVMKRRNLKSLLPQRKKIPFKDIITHINKISHSDKKIKKDKLTQKSTRAELMNIALDLESMDKLELEKKLDEIQTRGEEHFSEGASFKAVEYYDLTKKILTKLGRQEEVLIYSELIQEINRSLDARDRILTVLQQEKIMGDFMRIFNTYYELIEISKKLNDQDSMEKNKSELRKFFHDKINNTEELEKILSLSEETAASYYDRKDYENAANSYKECERLSHFLLQLGKEKDSIDIKKFRAKKNECLRNFRKNMQNRVNQ